MNEFITVPPDSDSDYIPLKNIIEISIISIENKSNEATENQIVFNDYFKDIQIVLLEIGTLKVPKGSKGMKYRNNSEVNLIIQYDKIPLQKPNWKKME